MPRSTGETTLADMVECAARELAMRKKVYPGLVRGKKMTADEAVWQRECMHKIHQWLEREALGQVQPELFPDNSAAAGIYAEK